MSFLEKPFVRPARAREDLIHTPVNYNLMKSFDKLDKNDVRNTSQDYCIIWVPGEAHQAGQSIIWRYPDKQCRDADFNDLVQKISVSLGS